MCLAHLLLFAVSLHAQIPDNLLKGMQYRLVGPFRGGRVLAVANIPGDPQTYYSGGASSGDSSNSGR